MSLIKALLQSSTQEQTGTIRTPGIQQTEEDSQEKNLDNGDNNMTTSQVSCGIDIKEEELGDLEKSLVNCCNSTAQLLSCDTVGTDEKEDGRKMKHGSNTSTSPQLSCTVGTVQNQQEMNSGNCYNTNTPSQLSCTVNTEDDQLRMDLGNCDNTDTPSQLSCSTSGIEVEKEGGHWYNTSKQSYSTVGTDVIEGDVLNLGDCYNTVTPRLGCSTVGTDVTDGDVPVLDLDDCCNTVELSCITVSVSTDVNEGDKPGTDLGDSDNTVTSQPSCGTVDADVIEEDEQEMNCDNCNNDSDTTLLLSCDTVASETNLGSRACDQQQVDTILSELDKTSQFDPNVNLPLIHSFHAYSTSPDAAAKQADKIPLKRDRTRKPAKSKWLVRSYEIEENVPAKVKVLEPANNATTPPQLKWGIVKCTDDKENGKIEKNLGEDSKTNTVTSALSWSIVSIDSKEEDILGEEEDDFEESEEELSSSEDERKGHKSDSSWHLSSEEDELFDDSDGSMSSCDSDQLERTERQLQRKIWRKNSWVCECGEKFKNMASYHKHILEEHPVTCDYCEEKFHSAKTLQKHLKTHLPSEDKLDLNGDKLSMCDHCGQFFTKQQMKRHKVKINDLRPFKCDVKNCASAFKTKGALKNHVRKVHERNRFPCTYEGCEKTFGIKSVLLKHYKVHTDERSHQCSYCGRMFQRTDHLKVHMRQHTGDTPFNCSLCNYSGRQSNCLIWHMKTHHPEHCEKSGDKKGAKQRKKKSGLEKDDKKGSKKGAKARKTSGLEMDDKMGAKKSAKPSNKGVLKKDALVDKVDSSKTLGSAKKKKALVGKAPKRAKKTATYSTRSQSHRGK
ncbi:uncharacterized protein LOC144879343 isoform X2 [Branchiostoma floridae x Branchiostoma japonicum]